MAAFGHPVAMAALWDTVIQATILFGYFVGLRIPGFADRHEIHTTSFRTAVSSP